jgi:uncharacterized protein (TIGR03067 family)
MRTRWLAVIVVGFFIGAVQAQDAVKKSADVKKDMEALQGTWQAVSGMRDGTKAPDDRINMIKWMFKGDLVTHRQASKYELDPTQNPKTIDLKPAESTDDDKTVKGIYEIKGDELTICVAPPGGTRPTEFASKPGSMTAILTLKKVK